MRSKFEDAVKHESSALKEAIPPIPAIVLYDIMCLSLDPQVEPNKSKPSDPSEHQVSNFQNDSKKQNLPHDMDEQGQIIWHSEARKGKHAVGEEITGIG